MKYHLTISATDGTGVVAEILGYEIEAKNQREAKRQAREIFSDTCFWSLEPAE